MKLTKQDLIVDWGDIWSYPWNCADEIVSQRYDRRKKISQLGRRNDSIDTIRGLLTIPFYL